MKRRGFIKGISAISTGLMVMPSACVFNRNWGDGRKVLKGFIVSDAHFGWDNPVQPSPEKQQQMIEHILNRFPDLDVFIDAGDAHHNGPVREMEKGLWTDIIKNPSSPVPFYYVAGNHEINHCRDKDPELICNQMGSVSCRPYYSWDIKGIHFISMPELVRTVFLNKEILEWVEFDLELNKDKTTIILSHNQILDTTSGHEPGYRGILNSDEVWNLMKKYPNVKAWMHGHNHNYEMIEKNGVLFVSNGRIGGFDPSREAHGLGGIYFEITTDKLVAKSYSAEKQKFLTKEDVHDNLHPQYHVNNLFRPAAELTFSTSLNSKAEPVISYGVGGANSGVSFPVAHHHAIFKGKSTLYISNNNNLTLNNDPDLKYFIRTGRWGEPDKKTGLMGGNIRGNYEWADPSGVKLLKSQKASVAVIQLPLENFDKYCYFKVAPGSAYAAQIEFDDVSGGQLVQIECKVHNSVGKEIKRLKSDLWTLEKNEKEKRFEVNLPEYKNAAFISTNEYSQNTLHISFDVVVNTSKGDVIVKRIAIEPISSAGNTTNPSVTWDGRKLERKGVLESWHKFDINNPENAFSICEVFCEGSKRLNWLVKHEGWDWQVRNAAVKDKDRYLEFNELRNQWTHRKEVVIVPAKPIGEAYVFKMRNALKARIYPLNRGNRKLHFLVENLAQGHAYAEVEIMNPGKLKIQGAEIIKTTDRKMVLKVLPGKEVYIG